MRSMGEARVRIAVLFGKQRLHAKNQDSRLSNSVAIILTSSALTSTQGDMGRAFREKSSGATRTHVADVTERKMDCVFSSSISVIASRLEIGAVSLCGRTMAVTGPPPINIDFTNDAIGGSASNPLLSHDYQLTSYRCSNNCAGLPLHWVQERKI